MSTVDVVLSSEHAPSRTAANVAAETSATGPPHHEQTLQRTDPGLV